MSLKCHCLETLLFVIFILSSTSKDMCIANVLLGAIVALYWKFRKSRLIGAGENDLTNKK